MVLVAIFSFAALLAWLGYRFGKMDIPLKDDRPWWWRSNPPVFSDQETLRADEKQQALFGTPKATHSIPASIFTPGDTEPTDINLDLALDQARGYSMMEAMERQGVIEPGNEVSSNPWEV